MSQATAFDLKVIRASAIGPRRLVVGARIRVDASTAAEMIRNGQARLIDDADLPVLAELTRAQQVRPRLLAP